MNFPSKRPFAAAFLILLAGVIVYSNSFQVPFVLDDYLVIEKNDVIRNLSNFFANSIGYSSSPTRFIGILTFAINYHLGGLEVAGYHVVNLLIHLVGGLLVYVLLRLTFRTPFFQFEGQSPETQPSTFHLSPSTFIPLFAALLFVVHPVQTQVVTYVVQRVASLATMFYLLSVVLYVKARLSLESQVPLFRSSESKGLKSKSLDIEPQHLEPRDKGQLSRRLVPILLLTGSVLSAALAMKTKEIAFTLPLAIVLYEAFFFKGSWRGRWFYLVPILATLPIVPLSVLVPIEPSSEILSDVGGQIRANTDISRLDYLFTQFRAIVTYLRLLILPINQNLDYDYPVYKTFFTPPVFLSFLLLAALLAFAVWCYRVTLPASRVPGRPSPPVGPEVRLLSYGIFWFFLTLSVESSIIPIADVISEHRLYLPSVGASAVLATGFFLVARKIAWARAGTLSILAAALVIASFGVGTFQRNQIWRDEVGLWEDVVSKSPRKPRPYNNLGNALNKSGKPWDAIPYLMEALALAPYFPEAHFNLGRSYLQVNQTALAIPYLQKAIKIKPDLDNAYIDLAAALNMEGRYPESARFMEQNLGRLGQMPEARFNLGVAYHYLGNEPAARRELAILAGLDPKMAARLAGFLGGGLKE